MGREPAGSPAPADGTLPTDALASVGSRPFGLYVHVPFCATRCGYCDFNTYTATDLGVGPQGGPSLRESWADSARREIDLAARVLGASGRSLPQIDTVFVGGGTPTLLPTRDLVAVLDHARAVFGLAADAEVTTEANPETVDRGVLDGLRGGGFTRLSLGMQHTDPAILRVLERTHTPGRAFDVVRWAREAGFAHTSLDLIYGAPGETTTTWRRALEAVVETGVDHVSAYALIVEPGTRLARAVATGRIPEPDEDIEADCYELADEILGAAGFAWYELSNWARPGGACRHNMGYWRSDDWWGIGPGAHSHVGGVRWWNQRHPAAWTAALAAGRSPAKAREELTAEVRLEERVLLELRLASGLPWTVASAAGPADLEQVVADLRAEGLVAPEPTTTAPLRLTVRGRLLADLVTRRLLA